MPHLLTPLDLRYLDGRVWLLVREFRYMSDIPGVGEICVPKYFVTDFNSQPRFLWRILPPTEFGEAAIPHDKMYREGKFSQETCDNVHREVLRYLGAPGWKIAMYFRGLRMFGHFAYNNYRKQEVMNGLDPLGRTPISDAVKSSIDAAFSTIPAGKKGALLVVVDTEGPRMHIAANVNNNWKIAAGVGKPWDGPVTGTVSVIGSW